MFCCTSGDIFENYCRDDNLATFGRFCYGVTVILTFPLECFVTREVRIYYIFSLTLLLYINNILTLLIHIVAEVCGWSVINISIFYPATCSKCGGLAVLFRHWPYNVFYIYCNIIQHYINNYLIISGLLKIPSLA